MRHITFGSFLAMLALSLHANAQPPAPDSPAPFRIGVIGLVHGHVDGFFHTYLHKAGVEIVAVAESDAALGGRYAERYHLAKSIFYTSVGDMLEKAHPQAVVTYTSTFDHRAVVEACATHGVHVMMEKPLAVSSEDAHAMARAASTGHIQVLVNFETTWYRSNRACYDLVHNPSKPLGEVRKIVAHDGHSGPKEIGCGQDFLNWLTDPKLNGAGALYDFGCYGADLATWLLDGQRPATVTAVTQQIKPDVYPKVDDEATIVLTYPKTQVIIQASWNWPFSRKDIEVYGKVGSALTVGDHEIRVRLPGDRPEQQSECKQIPAPEDDSLAYFRAVVLDGLKPGGLSSLETNVIVAEILDAARESAKTGATVPLSQTR